MARSNVSGRCSQSLFPLHHPALHESLQPESLGSPEWIQDKEKSAATLLLKSRSEEDPRSKANCLTPIAPKGEANNGFCAKAKNAVLEFRRVRGNTLFPTSRELIKESKSRKDQSCDREKLYEAVSLTKAEGVKSNVADLAALLSIFDSHIASVCVRDYTQKAAPVTLSKPRASKILQRRSFTVQGPDVL